MVLKPHGFNPKFPDIYMNLNNLAFVKEAQYLGVIVCNNLKVDEDILRHLRNFYARPNNTHHCSMCAKLHLFHIYIAVQFIVSKYEGPLLKG